SMRLVLCVLLCSVLFSLPSHADIAFSPSTTYEPGVATQWVGVADLDEDGNPDLVISESDSSRLVVLFGRGDGTFPSRVLIPIDATPLVGATGDLNGDGHVDLALATSSGIEVLLGDGLGAFVLAQTYPAYLQAYSFSLEIADLDGNGKPDLIFP